MMLPMLKNLGGRIRKLRKEKGLTLVDIAEKTGVAQATLSRIETGTMTGTVDSHERIAEVLGIGLAELYTGVDRRYEQISHQGKADSRKATHQSKNVHIELLTAESSKKKITPLLVTLQSHAQTSAESNERGVEKFLYVLDGEVQAKIESQEFNLSEGETLYFDASFSHSYKNLRAGTAKLLVAVSPSKI